jgi:hypothetical protein
MPDAKTFIYRYDGDHASEEEETDFEGKIDIPRMGDIMYRRDRTWKVTGVFSKWALRNCH